MIMLKRQAAIAFSGLILLICGSIVYWSIPFFNPPAIQAAKPAPDGAALSAVCLEQPGKMCGADPFGSRKVRQPGAVVAAPATHASHSPEPGDGAIAQKSEDDSISHELADDSLNDTEPSDMKGPPQRRGIALQGGYLPELANPFAIRSGQSTTATNSSVRRAEMHADSQRLPWFRLE